MRAGGASNDVVTITTESALLQKLLTAEIAEKCGDENSVPEKKRPAKIIRPLWRPRLPAAVVANRRLGATRDAEAYDEDDHQHRRGSGCGSREELNQDVIQTHNEEYRTNKSFQRGY